MVLRRTTDDVLDGCSCEGNCSMYFVGRVAKELEQEYVWVVTGVV